MRKLKTEPGQVRVLDSLPMLFVCIGVVIALYLVCLTGLASKNAMRYMVQIFLYIIMGEMWNLLSGFAGMTSLGQQLYIGLAGYSVAVALGPLKPSTRARKRSLSLFGTGLPVAGSMTVSTFHHSASRKEW